ncbi:MAG: hypothetical protein ABIP93_10400 [Gemmatimonadaceae bacterium]
MTATTSPRSATPRARAARRRGAAERTPLWIVGALVIGFLIGFGSQFGGARQARHDAAYSSRALAASHLEATLGSAVMEAQGGHFELARQRASAFFSDLQRRLLPTLDDETKSAARDVVAQRDPIITALARSDPASPSLLAEALTRYRALVHRAGLDSAVTVAPAP